MKIVQADSSPGREDCWFRCVAVQQDDIDSNTDDTLEVIVTSEGIIYGAYRKNNEGKLKLIGTMKDKFGALFARCKESWFGVVRWAPEDLIDLYEDDPDRPSLTYSQAADWLERNEKYIQSAMIQRGWDAINDLLLTDPAEGKTEREA